MASITIREKPLKGGRISLYLDIYENGLRKRERLGLYLYPEKNDAIRAKNRDTRQFADVIRGKRLVEAQNEAFGFVTRRDKAYFLPIYKKYIVGRNAVAYGSILAHLERYCPDKMQLAQVSRKWMVAFVDNLRDRGISDNSINHYVKLLKSFWNWCKKRNIVTNNPFEDIALNVQDAEIEYLTIEELEQLIATPFSHCVREPFLFSCFTGLRWSDVKKLTWNSIEVMSGQVRLRYKQKKTNKYEYMDIPSQAVALMGQPGKASELVFNCASNCRANCQLRKWVALAGINKHITFHCGRHTFATMLLTLGVDIMVVSKLLGHSSVAMTEVYAKVVDKNRREAVDRIPQLL